MDIGNLIPPRSLDDIVAQRVRLVVGGEVYDLLALSIEDTEAWVARMDGYLLGLLGSIEGDDLPARVVTALTGQTDKLLTLLASYDQRKVLPPRAVLRVQMTPFDLLCAVLEVWRAANPLVDIGIESMAPPVSTRRTSSSPRSTAGSPPSSGPN